MAHVGESPQWPSPRDRSRRRHRAGSILLRGTVCVIVGGAVLALCPASLAWAFVARDDRPGAATVSPSAEEVSLVAAEGAAGDRLGWSVALDGDTAVVGAPYDDVEGNPDQGSAYVFVRAGGSWAPQAQLVAPGGAAGDAFGRAVAIDGDTIVVGAPADDVGLNVNQGSVSVFVRAGATWGEAAVLTAPDGASWSGFGWSVALQGSTAVVGDPYHGLAGLVGAGAAYVFTGAGASWTMQQKLIGPAAAAGDWLGWSVALDADTAVVGAPGHNAGTAVDHGAAQVYVRSGATWTHQGELTAPDAAAQARLGDAVAVRGDTAFVAAGYDRVDRNAHQGSVSVYARSGTTWSRVQRLTDPLGEADDHYGSSLALHGGSALIGVENAGPRLAGGQPGNGRGAALAYVPIAGAWVLQARLTPATTALQDHFGFSVALRGETALVGVYADDVGGRADQGSAMVLAGGAPATNVTVRPAPTAYGWNRSTVTVTLDAKDVFSGVRRTEYRAAGAAEWIPYGAPFTVAASGLTTWEYRSEDVAGKAETARVLRVRIDRTRPVTKALADATVLRGRKAVLRMMVNDAVSPKAWGTIKIYQGRALRTTLMFNESPTNQVLRYAFVCTLPAGRYVWKVYAADLANNKQGRVGSASLIVR